MTQRYCAFFVLICLWDLLLTVLGIQAHVLEEGNSVLYFYFEYGGVEFLALVKLLMLFLGVFAIERGIESGRARAEFGRQCYRVLIVAYVLLYVGGIATVNR